MSNETPAVGEVPPGPTGLPILGNRPAFLRDPFGFMTRNAREYGDIVQWDEFGGPVYQLNHPDYVEHVLVRNNQNYVKGDTFQSVLGPVTGNGILNSEGAVWRRNRHRIQPAFHPDRIQVYSEMMTDLTEAAIDEWADGETREFHEDMMAVTLKIVARALFGVDIDEHVDTIGRTLEVFMAGNENLANFLLPRGVPTPSRRRTRKARRELDAIVYRLIDEHRDDPSGEGVISTLVTATDDEGRRALSDEQVRDEVVTLLLAGHETTALSLTLTAYALARHPAAEERLVDELAEVLEGDVPTMADLADLTYIEQVAKESMRLYPPVPGIVREPTKPDEIGGYTIPAGATVQMNQWTVHRDPRWYDDPRAFRPGRWTSEFEKSLPKLAYFPFAAGPRRCIGDRFAMLEARLMLATIYQRYHLELTPEADLDLMATVTARPKKPIPMTVHRRD